MAMPYSSMSGSLVKWKTRGSSVESDTLRPRLKKDSNGFFSKPRNSALLLMGLIASPICE